MTRSKTRRALREDSRATFSVAGFFSTLLTQFPNFRYVAFGFYYAWIFLDYSSMQLFPAENSDLSIEGQTAMYGLSTVALAGTLIAAALFHAKTERLVNSFGFVTAAGFVASFATAGVAATFAQNMYGPLFVVTSLVTGLGTAFVALRFGAMFSTLPMHKIMVHTAAAFVLACMLYYTIIGLPYELSLAGCVSLPLLAALFTAPLNTSYQKDESLVLPAKELPSGFLVKLIIAVSVFSLVSGFYRGLRRGEIVSDSAGSLEAFATNESNMLVVFFTAVFAISLFILVCVVSQRFDLSKLYYPIILLTCFAVVIVPVMSTLTALQDLLLGVAYNVFIIFIWCLMAHVAHSTDLDAVQTFGWGRGASALGTTIGWMLGAWMGMSAIDLGDLMTTISIMVVLALLIVSMIIFKEGTIDDVLTRTDWPQNESQMGDSLLFATADKSDASDTAAITVQNQRLRQKGAWTKSCNMIAEKYGLSSRECEVLFLLGKGRTIEAVSNELTISFNTAKSHIRHVYTKTGVHSRQELIELIEENRTWEQP